MTRSVFLAEPSESTVVLDLHEVLLDRTDCVVTSTALDNSALFAGAGQANPVVSVWWPSEEGTLKLAALWQGSTPEQVWMDNCDLSIRGVTP